MTVPIAAIDITRGDVTDRQHTTLVRESLRYAANRHKNVTLGKHFKDIPETRPGGAYGYVERSAKYRETKLKKFGASAPLVLTGKLRRVVRNNSIVRATSTRGATLYIRGYFPLNAQRRKELEALSPADVQFAQEQAREFYRKESTKPANRRKRKRRIS